MRQSSPQEVADMFKSLVRPFLICSAWLAWLLMIFAEIEVPQLLQGIASAITGEYIIERVVKRIRNK